jgi:LemA protein
VIFNWLAAGISALLTWCNDFQGSTSGIKSAWSEVLNQYQRRADRVLNIVATVKVKPLAKRDNT